MRYFLLASLSLLTILSISQPANSQGVFSIVEVPYTSVKNQANSGTCWSFSAISMLESEALSRGLKDVDLSEMFVVRHIYVDKAKNYLLKQGAVQFSSGGLGHDVILAIDKYGIVPESAYSGLPLGLRYHDHSKLDAALKTYLDSLLKVRPIPDEWLVKYESILDEHLGKLPSTFVFQEKSYTPITFAREVLKFEKKNYVFLTSFTHQPLYSQFSLEIPDNYGAVQYHNVKLSELISIVEHAILNGNTAVWDTDISNPNFRHKEGLALQFKDSKTAGKVDIDDEEEPYDEEIRQKLFENLTTQDDHLLHIVGIEKHPNGKKFFIAKNSWGDANPAKGIIKISEAYFAINTISLVLPVSALDKDIRKKLAL